MKLLPFLLRLPQILVVNENGHFFQAHTSMSDAVPYRRVLHGVSSPISRPKILFIQTETPRYVTHAIKKLKEGRIHPHSEIVLVCCEQDREEFERNSTSTKS